MDENTNRLLTSPPAPLLLKMATPNALAFFIQSSVSLAEVWFIGQLGTQALAAIALAFPLLMLVQMMAGGAVGGAVTSSIARALGSGNIENANRLVWHALAIAAAGALLFLVLFLSVGTKMLEVLGGNGDVLDQAASYCLILFSGSIFLWLIGIVGAIFRGMGDMKLPAMMMVMGALLQISLSGVLILGLFGVPQLGVVGAAISAVTSAIIVSSAMLFALSKPWRVVRLDFRAISFSKTQFDDILRVAMPGALSPILTVLIVLSLTAMVATYGEAALAGFGIGSRIEFLLIPLIFGIGAAMTSLVGLSIGAGNFERAERIGWIGGAMAAGLTGFIGVTLALFPEAWIYRFTSDVETYEAAQSYIQIVGPVFAFQGLGLSLYFASQGAGKMAWPIGAMITRAILAIGGGWFLAFRLDLGLQGLFLGIAAAMTVFGVTLAASVKLRKWRDR